MFGWLARLFTREVDPGPLEYVPERPKKKKPVKALKKDCQKCRKHLESYADRFRCKYCEDTFCAKHRLPERHDCTGITRTQRFGSDYRNRSLPS